jgi:hypothetical protein
MAGLAIQFKLGDTVHTPGNVEVANELLGQQVRLSTFSVGTITTYEWMLLDIPEGSQAVLDSPTAPTPHFTPDLDGTYLVRLIVNKGAAGERRAMAYIGFYTYFLETRIPAAGETMEEGARGWAAEVGAGLRKVVNVSGRGGVWLCANASGATLDPGTAVMLAELPAGQIRPRVVKATRDLYALADPALAFIGFVLGDPVYRKAVADGGDVAVAFGPGIATGLAIGGDEPEAYPAPIALGETAGTVVFGDAPVIVAHAFNRGVAILTPARPSAQPQEGFQVVTGDTALTLADLAAGRIVLADAESVAQLGRSLALTLPAVAEDGFAKARVVARNGDVEIAAPEGVTIHGLETLSLTDRECAELAYYDGDWLLIGGTMLTITAELGTATMAELGSRLDRIREAQTAGLAEVRRIGFIVNEEFKVQAPPAEEFVSDEEDAFGDGL